MLPFCSHSKQNTQEILFHALIFKTIIFKTAERLNNIRIRKFEHDTFSIPFSVTSSEKRTENEFFKSKFGLHDRKSSRGPNNMFDLDLDRGVRIT